jgi:hypothetical protein
MVPQPLKLIKPTRQMTQRVMASASFRMEQAVMGVPGGGVKTADSGSLPALRQARIYPEFCGMTGVIFRRNQKGRPQAAP